VVGLRSVEDGLEGRSIHIVLGGTWSRSFSVRDPLFRKTLDLCAAGNKHHNNGEKSRGPMIKNQMNKEKEY
jgi:hypothetical protein